MKAPKRYLSLVLSVVLALLVMNHSRPAHAESASGSMQDSTNFPVEFTDCVESIGVTLVSTERARALVPSEFHLVGEGATVTPLVVRTARCEIAVAGQRPNVGSIAQFGLVIVPPDFTGDINNYTLGYYTTDAELANHLVRLGVGAQHVQNIAYSYVPELAGSPVPFSVDLPRPGDPTFSLSGTVTRSETSSGSFVANWWQKGRRGSVKMNTDVPSIYIGGANLTLTTDPNNDLGLLIGGGSMGFPVLQQFNTFSGAHMEVTSVQ